MEITEQDPEEWIQNQKQKQFSDFQEREVVGTHCDDCQFSPDPVIKRGSLEADLMLVGEFPTGEDLQSNEPFTGELEELLTEMIEAIDLDLDEDCYLTNSLLCGGADVQVVQASVDACRTNLYRQLELVSPSVAIGMGRFAWASLYERSIDEELSDPWGYQGTLPEFPWVHGVITVNPIHLLEVEDGSSKKKKLKKLAWKNLKTARKLLDETAEESREERQSDEEHENSE